MQIEILIKEELLNFKSELIQKIKQATKSEEPQAKQWLRSSEVWEIIKISSGALQNLFIKGILPYKKIGGIFYGAYVDIVQSMNYQPSYHPSLTSQITFLNGNETINCNSNDFTLLSEPIRAKLQVMSFSFWGKVASGSWAEPYLLALTLSLQGFQVASGATLGLCKPFRNHKRYTFRYTN